MKRPIALLVLLLFLLTLAACGREPGRIVHCDRCGREIQVDADSDVTEEWILFCRECEEELFDSPQT